MPSSSPSGRGLPHLYSWLAGHLIVLTVMDVHALPAMGPSGMPDISPAQWRTLDIYMSARLFAATRRLVSHIDQAMPARDLEVYHQALLTELVSSPFPGLGGPDNPPKAWAQTVHALARAHNAGGHSFGWLRKLASAITTRLNRDAIVCQTDTPLGRSLGLLPLRGRLWWPEFPRGPGVFDQIGQVWEAFTVDKGLAGRLDDIGGAINDDDYSANPPALYRLGASEIHGKMAIDALDKVLRGNKERLAELREEVEGAGGRIETYDHDTLVNAIAKGDYDRAVEALVAKREG